MLPTPEESCTASAARVLTVSGGNIIASRLHNLEKRQKVAVGVTR